MRWRYVDVSRDPAAAARSGASEATREVLRSLGFSLLGHAMTQLDFEPLYVAELWRSGDGDMLFSAFRWKEREELTVYSLLEDGTFVETERKLEGISAVWITHAIRPPRASGFHWYPCPITTPAPLIEAHRANVAKVTADGVRAVPHDMTSYFAMRLRGRELADARDTTRKRVEDHASTVMAFTCWIPAVPVALEYGLLAGLLAFCAAVPVGVVLVQLTGVWLSPVIHRSRRWRRVSLLDLLERASSIPVGEIE
jgi:hypothetical protein